MDPVSLRDYLEHQIAAQARICDEREHASVALELEREKALVIARATQDHRDEQANALRQQIASERGLYVTTDVLEAKLATVEAEFRQLAERNASRIAVLETQVANWQGRLIASGAILTLVLALTGIAIRFIS